jgi:nicotinate dehydrogenase subunit B
VTPRAEPGVSLSRREFLGVSGALIVRFSLFSTPRAIAQGLSTEAKLPGALAANPLLDSWIRIGADGSITVFTGKVEFGQGIKTALIQVAAEELGVVPRAINLITADTGRTPDEGYTAGSNSMKDSATAIMNAAAQVREIMIARAAERLNVAADTLQARDAIVIAADGRRVGFGELIGGDVLRVRAEARSRLKDPATYTIVGKPLPRVDIPAKVTGGVAYVHDLRLPGMVHARAIRPPGYGARLRDVNTAEVQKMPGVIGIVRDGSFLAVVAQKEFQAVAAMRALSKAASWEERAGSPDQADVYAALQRMPSEAIIDQDSASPANAGVRTVEASYRRPYLMHGAIGPACAVGLFDFGTLTLWTHSQGIYPLRKSVAEMLRLPEDRVHCIHVEGSGCYGHNAADDAAADAALIARAVPGRPVRVQWMREQEHLWEPYGPAMVGRLIASLDESNTIVSWQYDVWSTSHSTRPGGAGNLMPAWHLEAPFAQPIPRPIPMPEGGGDRNAIPLYKFSNVRVVHHFVPAMPVRVSALRSLGAYLNVFAIESFIDELAKAANADPVAFRLRHLEDARARDIITMAASRFGWSAYAPVKGRGRGFAFARYKNLGAYVALAVEVAVDRETGGIRVLRAIAAVDSGQIVNPDGLRNQIEGGIVQSTSWTLFEAVTFNDRGITSTDWSRYPILRFPDLPERVDVELVDRPGQPFLGTGEAAQGPTAAALANALADATGVRVRELPLTRKRVKAAIGI